MARKRFTILSGPSCVGKGPLVAALNRFHPDVKYAQIPVIKDKRSRPNGPRPEEVGVWDNPDYFREEAQFRDLRNDPQYLVGDCRMLPQAVDLRKVHETKAELLFIEIYHTIGAKLIESRFLTGVEIRTVFVAPIGRQEIKDLRSAGVDLDGYLTQLMLHKQLVRGSYQGKSVDIKDARERASLMSTDLPWNHVFTCHRQPGWGS